MATGLAGALQFYGSSGGVDPSQFFNPDSTGYGNANTGSVNNTTGLGHASDFQSGLTYTDQNQDVAVDSNGNVYIRYKTGTDAGLWKAYNPGGYTSGSIDPNTSNRAAQYNSDEETNAQNTYAAIQKYKQQAASQPASTPALPGNPTFINTTGTANGTSASSYAQAQTAAAPTSTATTSVPASTANTLSTPTYQMQNITDSKGNVIGQTAVYPDNPAFSSYANTLKQNLASGQTAALANDQSAATTNANILLTKAGANTLGGNVAAAAAAGAGQSYLQNQQAVQQANVDQATATTQNEQQLGQALAQESSELSQGIAQNTDVTVQNIGDQLAQLETEFAGKTDAQSQQINAYINQLKNDINSYNAQKQQNSNDQSQGLAIFKDIAMGATALTGVLLAIPTGGASLPVAGAAIAGESQIGK